MPQKLFWCMYTYSLKIPQSDILLVLGWYSRCYETKAAVLDRKQGEYYYALTHWQAVPRPGSIQRKEGGCWQQLRVSEVCLLYPIIRVFCEWFVNLLVRPLIYHANQWFVNMMIWSTSHYSKKSNFCPKSRFWIFDICKIKPTLICRK